jgi:hypothetical protein
MGAIMSEDIPPAVNDADEVPDEEILALVQSLPDRAAVVLRKLLYRVRRLMVGFDTVKTTGQNQKQQLDAVQVTVGNHTDFLASLNQARQTQATKITNLEGKVAALEARLPPTP